MTKLRVPIGQMLDDRLPEAQVQRIWRRLQRPAARRSRIAWPLPLMAATTLVLLGVAGWLGLRGAHVSGGLAIDGAEPLGARRVLGGEIASAWPLSDGSRIRLARASRLEVLENTAHTFTARLESGHGHFEVKPGGPRRWRIDCGALSVEVVGTSFELDRDARGVSVEVRHGVVRVRSAQITGGEQRVTAGERLYLRAEQQSAARALEAEPGQQILDAKSAAPSGKSGVPPSADPAGPRPSGKTASSASPTTALSPPSRTPAAKIGGSERGTSARTAASASERSQLAAADDAWPPTAASASQRAADHSRLDDLLRQADRARRTGRVTRAEALLERIRAGWPGTPHAALASLTLARMRIATAPERAANDLEDALAAELPHGLREDALARLVEAYARAGQLELARSTAQKYRRAFPDGRRAAEIERWTQLP